jgi:hypothetical protein
MTEEVDHLHPSEVNDRPRTSLLNDLDQDQLLHLDNPQLKIDGWLKSPPRRKTSFCL